ncbi:MAG: peptide chain release factor N(5)-glutamine methyltransferase [Henriciella sp.]
MPLSHGQAMQQAAQRLMAAGVEAPLSMARNLLKWATGFSAIDLIQREPDAMSAEHARQYETAIRHVEARRPVAHLTGTADFYGLVIKSDHRALIPRPDSEVVIDLALEKLPEKKPVRILDLGTGSGCLLLALLSRRPLAQGVGIDASADALSLARENASLLHMTDRARFDIGNWSSPDAWQTADLVISNPPYIATSHIAALAPEVRDHDPGLALDGGKDGLDAYREIISLAARHLKPGASLVLEIGFDQKSDVSGLLVAAGLTITGHRTDLGKNDRAIGAIRS